MNEMIIREYNTHDIISLENLIDFNTPRYFDPEEKNDFLNYLQNEREDYFVVELDDLIVGCGGINYEENKSIGIISWDIIHPDFQGKGIGRELLNYRLELLKTNNTTKKIIVRTSQLTDKFYEKNGFVLTRVIKDYWANGFDLYFMEMKV